MSSIYTAPSTDSLQSNYTVSSKTPLRPSPSAPQKDYAAAFANLQSSYGTADGSLPTPPVAKKPIQPKAKTISSPPSSDNVTPPVPSQPKPQKDFEAAFGQLSSSYGAVGAPTLPVKKKEKKETRDASSSKRKLFSCEYEYNSIPLMIICLVLTTIV